MDDPMKNEWAVEKYVSELSTVRDCATECAEKEIWETKTYCCAEDGCNGSNKPVTSIILFFLVFLLTTATAFRH